MTHLEFMKEKGISISGSAETNTNWQQKHIKKDMSNSTQSSFTNYSIAFLENWFNPPNRNHHLPGGCMQLSTDHWTSRLIRTIQDPQKMSRWTGQQFRLREGKTLTIITAYRTCNQSISDSNQPAITATYQQKLLFMRDKGTDVDPQQQFITDIIEEIKRIEENPNNMYILMFDANESIEDTSGAIRKITAETTLVDTFSQVAGDPGNLATYIRGKKRINYILKSQALVSYVSRVGYLAFFESNHSDHRGLFLDISESILDTKVRLTRPMKGHIGSKSKPMISTNINNISINSSLYTEYMKGQKK
jgi:hypothetical protein